MLDGNIIYLSRPGNIHSASVKDTCRSLGTFPISAFYNLWSVRVPSRASSTFSLLVFSYLFLFSKPLSVTGRSVCEAAILILVAKCVSIKISYAAIRNSISYFPLWKRVLLTNAPLRINHTNEDLTACERSPWRYIGQDRHRDRNAITQFLRESRSVKNPRLYYQTIECLINRRLGWGGGGGWHS